MFLPGTQDTRASRFNAEWGVDTFRAGQKVRTSQLVPELVAGEWLRAPEMNLYTGDGGGPSGTPADPGEALWIGHGAGSNFFNVGIGQGNAGVDGDTNHDDFTMAQIADGYIDPDRFFLVQFNSQWWTEFRINAGAGRTSTGTDHPRSELRELLSNNANAAWNGTTGWHRMKGTSRVGEVTTQRPWVCFFQIHDASSDLIRIQCEGTVGQTTGLDLRARWTPPGGSDQSVTLPGWDNTYDVGEVVDWEIWIGGPTDPEDLGSPNDDGRCRVWINDALVFNEADMGTSGCYFKTGCYLQSNVHIRGEDPDDEAAVQILAGSLEVWHTGYPDPTPPVFTG